MSCIPYIDRAIICDVGSTDKTIEIASQFLSNCDKPFISVKIQWNYNFAQARNCYLKEIKMSATHTLVLDADELLVLTNDNFKETLPDVGLVQVRDISYGDDHFYPKIFKNHPNVFYEGDIRETPIFPEHFQEPVKMKNLYIRDRSFDTNRVEKYMRELEICLRKDPFPHLPGRRAYYLALSAFHTRRMELAMHWFKKRSEMEEGCSEEKWHATMMVGSCYLIKDELEEGIKWLKRASLMRPWRLEPLALMERYYIMIEDYENLKTIQMHLTLLPYPENDTLAIQDNLYFVEPSDMI